MSSDFWKNKKVLITGHEGFLGSWLTKKLLGKEARIIGLDILTGRKKTVLAKNDLGQIKALRASVEDFSLLSNVLRNNKIEFIFHLAAKSLVGCCLRNPRQAFLTNIKGTWNVLEAGRHNHCVKGLIIASSDKAYGSHKSLPYKENFSLCGEHPYDVSKSCADLLAKAYFHTYGLPVCVTRCGNIYGPGDFNFSRIVPDTIRSILKNETLMIRSDGSFLRDYIYIDDIVDAYLLLSEKMERSRLFGETFNFSNQDPISVLDLVKCIYQIAGGNPDYKILNESDHEIINQYLSAEKARKILDWKSNYDLKSGLKKTISWYEEFLR